jgi:hypothetical protein
MIVEDLQLRRLLVRQLESEPVAAQNHYAMQVSAAYSVDLFPTS